MKRGRICIGTSGWNYSHWRGTFYPQELPQSEWLRYYSERLQSVEINNTFYRLPERSTMKRWEASVPDSFRFAVKASRYITHMKKLKDPELSTSRFFRRIEPLEGKLGPILFQLPPHWKQNSRRLEGFIGQLPPKRSYTFEFRDPSWFDPQIYRILERAGAAFCIYHLAGESSPKTITADFVYIRLHGPADAYEGLYDRRTLSGWAGAISAWSRGGREVYCYFDNDQNGYAAKNAIELREMLG
ncbi:MAG: DUF72 domain-containing protein [Spirochaetales bacterium]|nr:DUF72 domain-containing protein [Spirochaetales bacterium]